MAVKVASHVVTWLEMLFNGATDESGNSIWSEEHQNRR